MLTKSLEATKTKITDLKEKGKQEELKTIYEQGLQTQQIEKDFKDCRKTLGKVQDKLAERFYYNLKDVMKHFGNNTFDSSEMTFSEEFISKWNLGVKKRREQLEPFDYGLNDESYGFRIKRGLFTNEEEKLAYEGEWLEGTNTIQGRGIMMRIEGQIEEGWFRNALLDGKGRKILPTLDMYSGYFKEGRLDGYGTYYNNNNGFTYKGDFKKGNRHGQGVAVWSNGDRYEGQFRFGKCHG